MGVVKADGKRVSAVAAVAPTGHVHTTPRLISPARAKAANIIP